jgi:amylosucrase
LNYLRCHDDIGWGLDYDWMRQFGTDEVVHKRYLNDFFTGNVWDSFGRGELYNDDPRLGDDRLCGTTASLCGVERYSYEKNQLLLDRSIQCDIMLHAFMLIQSGIPILYAGDEIGQQNDYTYHEDPLKQDDSRYIHRGSMDWEKAENRKDKTTTEGKIYQAIQKLIQIRETYKVFETGADTWTIDTWDDHVLGIGRYLDGEKVIALFNFSEESKMAWINEPDEDYVDLLTGKPKKASGVAMPPYGFYWLYKKYDKDSE